MIKIVVIVLRAEFGETFADFFFGKRRNPETFHRFVAAGFLHHPSLNQFTFLAGITAVNHLVGLINKAFDGFELSNDALVVDKFDAETLRNHRQRAKTPRFPLFAIVVRFFEATKVSEGPSNVITVAFEVAIAANVSAQNIGDVFSNRRFLGYTYYHDVKIFIRVSKLNSISAQMCVIGA